MLNRVLFCALTSVYFVLSQECGTEDITLDASKKDITFPPSGKFTTQMKCVYQIKGSPEMKLSLQITAMKLENVPETECTSSYFKVAESKADLENNANITCGLEKHNFTLSGNTMAIEISGKKDEFVKATVIQEPIPKTDCGESKLVLTGDTKDVHFPVGTFKADGECTYQISGGEGKKLSIQVTEMKLGETAAVQSNIQCSDYYLKVADSESALTSTTQISCGNEKPTFAASGNTMAIKVRGKAEDYVKAVITQNAENITSDFAIQWSTLLLSLACIWWKY